MKENKTSMYMCYAGPEVFSDHTIPGQVEIILARKIYLREKLINSMLYDIIPCIVFLFWVRITHDLKQKKVSSPYNKTTKLLFSHQGVTSFIQY